MKHKKTIFITISLLFYFLGYFISEKNDILVKSLSLDSIIHIFLLNSIFIIMLFILFPTGLSLLFILINLFGMGVSAKESGVPFYYYIPISLLHGILEIICLYLLFKITIELVSSYISFFKQQEKENSIKLVLKRGFCRYLPLSIILLLLGAFIEVIISNKLLLSLVN